MAQAYTSGAVPDLVVGVGLQHALKHGAWLPILKERGIAYTTANRFIRLRQQYSEINQLGEFDSVSSALTRGRSVPVYCVTAGAAGQSAGWACGASRRRAPTPVKRHQNAPRQPCRTMPAYPAPVFSGDSVPVEIPGQ